MPRRLPYVTLAVGVWKPDPPCPQRSGEALYWAKHRLSVQPTQVPASIVLPRGPVYSERTLQGDMRDGTLLAAVLPKARSRRH